MLGQIREPQSRRPCTCTSREECQAEPKYGMSLGSCCVPAGKPSGVEASLQVPRRKHHVFPGKATYRAPPALGCYRDSWVWAVLGHGRVIPRL